MLSPILLINRFRILTLLLILFLTPITFNQETVSSASAAENHIPAGSDFSLQYPITQWYVTGNQIYLTDIGRYNFDPYHQHNIIETNSERLGKGIFASTIVAFNPENCLLKPGWIEDNHSIPHYISMAIQVKTCYLYPGAEELMRITIENRFEEDNKSWTKSCSFFGSNHSDSEQDYIINDEYSWHELISPEDNEKLHDSRPLHITFETLNKCDVFIRLDSLTVSCEP